MVSLDSKKLFSMMLICMFWKSCFAGTMGGELKPVDHYNGVYIGADLGLMTLFDNVIAPLDVTLPANQLSSTTTPIGHFGITGGGILGYDYSLLQKIKLGIEGYINGTSVTIKQTATVTVPNFDYGSTVTQQNYAWGFRALPGYEIYPGVVAHLILGYSNAQFTINAPPPVSGLVITQPIVNETFTCNGFQSGLGLTSIAYHNFSLRFDGLFTTYGAHSSPSFVYSNPAAGTLAYTGTYKNILNTFEADLTLSYKFA